MLSQTVREAVPPFERHFGMDDLPRDSKGIQMRKEWEQMVAGINVAAGRCKRLLGTVEAEMEEMVKLTAIMVTEK